MTYNEETIEIKIGSQSLVGIHGNPPHEWGNYFSLIRDGREIEIVNMWVENLEALKDKLENKIKLRIYRIDDRYVAIVIDERVPQEYLYNKCCFTGFGSVPLEVAKDIYGKLGDPDNELEQFTNPEKYYKDRGWDYDAKSGIISKKISSECKKLRMGFTIKEEIGKVVVNDSINLMNVSIDSADPFY